MDFKLIPSICALNGGEDYELLFTVKQNDYEKIREVEGISIIGHITPSNDGTKLVTSDGKMMTITAQGWDTMRK